jgi:site-specific DNA-methyltransferase (adenine-specific)
MIAYMDKSEHGSIANMQGDCLEKLDEIKEKSIQSIIIDPPYNISKDEWDKWDSTEDYTEWLITIIEKLEKVLRDNGSFFLFHNDMEQISEIMVKIKSRTSFKFRQMITWNKRFEGSKKKGYLDGYIVKNDLHNWNKMAEYILFYTFENSWKLKEERTKRKINSLTISKEILSRTGGITGWYSNIETGKNMPTRETIVPIEKHLGITYEDIVPKYLNQKTDHSVWNYDMAARCKVHITPKPVDLLENILKHVTEEGDIVLDCFAGSGSMGQACKNLNRRCILIEKDETYHRYINETLELLEERECNWFEEDGLKCYEYTETETEDIDDNPEILFGDDESQIESDEEEPPTPIATFG